MHVSVFKTDFQSTQSGDSKLPSTSRQLIFITEDEIHSWKPQEASTCSGYFLLYEPKALVSF